MKLFILGMAVATVGYFLWEKFAITDKILALFGKFKSDAEEYGQKIKKAL